MSEETVDPTAHVAADVTSPEHEATGEEANEQVMDLLSEHVPLSLIMDLSSPVGPDSEQILEAEGEPDDAWWEPVASTTSPATPETA